MTKWSHVKDQCAECPGTIAGRPRFVHPRDTARAIRPSSGRLVVTALALAACSAGQRDRAVHDSVPATTTPAPRASATVAAAPAPLSGDSVVVSPGDTGVRVGIDGRLLLPIVFAAACQGEDCESSFTGLACAPVELHAAADTASPVVARVAKGDSVHVRRTDLHVLAPGIVIVKRSFVLDTDAGGDSDPAPRADTLRFTEGDTVYLLRYEMLGSWLYRWKGRTTDGNEFWGGPFDAEGLGGNERDTSRAVARSQPVSDDWWLLDDGTRPIGWWRTDSLASLRSERTIDYWGDHCPASPPSSVK